MRKATAGRFAGGEGQLDKTEKLFKELTEASGISGFEDEVADIMAAHLKGVAKISYDNLGSLVAEKKGSAAFSVPGMGSHS